MEEVKEGSDECCGGSCRRTKIFKAINPFEDALHAVKQIFFPLYCNDDTGEVYGDKVLIELEVMSTLAHTNIVQ